MLLWLIGLPRNETFCDCDGTKEIKYSRGNLITQYQSGNTSYRTEEEIWVLMFTNRVIKLSLETR